MKLQIRNGGTTCTACTQEAEAGRTFEISLGKNLSQNNNKQVQLCSGKTEVYFILTSDN
jgi:hypothetical protein